MRKDELIKLGLSEADAEKVAAASSEELKGYVPMTRFNEVNEAKKTAEQAVKDRDSQIDGLKTAAGNADTLKLQIEHLQSENKKKDEAHAAEILALKVDNAVEAALTGAGAVNNRAVKALLDLTDAKIGDDGKVVGLADQIDKLKSASDSSMLFATAGKPKLKGAKTGEEGHEEGDGKPDLTNMTYDELCAYLAENPDVNIN